MAYLTGEARARLDAFKAVMVKHTRLSEVNAALRLLIEEHAEFHAFAALRTRGSRQIDRPQRGHRAVQQRGNPWACGPNRLAGANSVGYRSLCADGLLPADRHRAERTHPGQRTLRERGSSHGCAQILACSARQHGVARYARGSGASAHPCARQCGTP